MVNTEHAVGKYKHEKNEGMDEYFAAIGVPFIARKMMNSTSPTVEIVVDGDNWSITTSSMLRTVKIEFQLGKPYQETMADNTILNCVASFNGDKLVIDGKVIVDEKEIKSTRLYEFDQDGMTVTFHHDTAVGKRFFKRIH